MEETNETLLVFGTALRKARESCNFTIEALAAKSGIAVDKVAAYEAGNEEVSLLEVCALAKAMNLTPKALFANADF